MKTRMFFYVWLAVLVVLVGLGVYAWNIQYAQGLAVTGMGDITIWGIYITSFVFLVGASVGIMITINIGYILNEEKFKPFMKIGGLLAIACILPAMLLVAADIGRPERILNIVLFGNPQSMFVLDFIFISIALVLRVIFTLIFSVEKGGKTIAGFFAVFEIVLAVFEHSVTAWIFGVIIARAAWNTALLAPIFISSALVSGVALLMLVTILTSKFTELKIPSGFFSLLWKALAATISVDFFFIFTQAITTSYAATPGLLSALSTVLSGPYASVILIEIALFFVVFLPIVYRRTRNSMAILGIASLVTIAAIWAKRFFLLIPGFSLSQLGELGTYMPTLIEWQITIGLFAFGALLYSLSLKVLPSFVIDFWGTLELSKSESQKSPSVTRASEPWQGEKETRGSNVSRRDFLRLTAGAAVGAAAVASIPGSSILLSKQEVRAQASVNEWAMVVDLRRCIGCQACLAACKSENGVPLGIQYTWVETHEEGKYPNTKLTFVPRLCNHCDNPPCTPVCPVHATYKRESDGIVMQDMNRCIGCRYCMAACPYEVRSFLWKEPSGAWPQVWNGKAEAKQGFVVKCHGCYHRIEKGLKPACVETCVGGARVFGDLQDPNSEVSKIVRSVSTQRLKAHLGARPMVYYVGLSDTIAERGKKAPDTVIVH